jgi:N-acetylmuramoyl-L-alanine amidase
VKQGETLASIAELYGFTDWSPIYNHGDNRELKKSRPNPFVLYPGDEVVIPELEKGEEGTPTEKRHRFRLKRRKRIFRIIIQNEDGEPEANEDWELDLGEGEPLIGTTDSDGRLETPIPYGPTEGILRVIGMEFAVHFAGLDPVTRTTGVQQRLNNLGFGAGAEDGIIGRLTKLALLAFQRAAGLDETGALDDATRKALLEHHDGDDAVAAFEDDAGEQPDEDDEPEPEEEETEDPEGDAEDVDEEADNEPVLQGEEPLDTLEIEAEEEESR